MKFYIASGIKNKESVKKNFVQLKARGHEVTIDWTLTDEIPENVRDNKREYVRSIAKRDFEGIRECDVFILLSDPQEGRSIKGSNLRLTLASYFASMNICPDH